MSMRRGDIVVVAFSGDYGKPRPALVIQNDAFEQLPSLTVLPLTSDLHPAPLIRINISPSADNGLERHSHVMVDKTTTVPRSKIGRQIGRLEPETMRQVGLALSRFLELQCNDAQSDRER